jgi:hypothetical protein
MAFNPSSGAMAAAGSFLRWPRLLVKMVLLISLLTIVALALDIRIRSADQDQTAVRWMRRLDLTTPALWPAGTAPRSPELHCQAVDLRLTPFLGLALDGPMMPMLSLSGDGQGETAR